MSGQKGYSAAQEEREAVAARLTEHLKGHPEIAFAYIHGSFRKGEHFRDIDLAVYLKNGAPGSPLQYEIGLEAELMRIVRYPVDMRVLNSSPLSFRYRVIKDGSLLFARNDDERADFQEATLAAYFDFSPYRILYLKETLGSGV